MVQCPSKSVSVVCQSVLTQSQAPDVPLEMFVLPSVYKRMVGWWSVLRNFWWAVASSSLFFCPMEGVSMSGRLCGWQGSSVVPAEISSRSRFAMRVSPVPFCACSGGVIIPCSRVAQHGWSVVLRRTRIPYRCEALSRRRPSRGSPASLSRNGSRVDRGWPVIVRAMVL